MSTKFLDDATIQTLTPEQEYVALLGERQRRAAYKRWETYKPYPKQLEWFGFKSRIKVLFGGNRVGKTLTAAFEVVCHLTGRYPDWWTGRRFFQQVQVRCIGVKFEQVRKVIQSMLLGDIRHGLGTGMIPNDAIVDKPAMRPGLTDTVSTIWVRHSCGGVSVCELMANEQGREAFQGDSKDVIWEDEEVDKDVHDENKMRTAGGGDRKSGIMLITFTPLKGWTPLARYLYDEPDPSIVRKIVLGWDDVPHLTEQDKKELSAGLLPHEIEARRTGLPSMASGLIYPMDPKLLLVHPFDFESYDTGIIGLDVAPVGVTAGSLLMHDYHSKITYMAKEHYAQRSVTAVHSMALKSRFGRYPVRIDPSSKRGEKEGSTIVEEYRECLGEDWEVKFANNAVDDGIRKLYTAMMEGRFKVFSNCHNWIHEWQNYIWDEKKKDSEGHPMPRKKDDHMMDATRYGYMDIAEAKPEDYRDRQNVQPAWKPLDNITGY